MKMAWRDELQESSPRQNDVWDFKNSHKANIYLKSQSVNIEGREEAASEVRDLTPESWQKSPL